MGCRRGGGPENLIEMKNLVHLKNLPLQDLDSFIFLWKRSGFGLFKWRAGYTAGEPGPLRR